MIMLDDDDSGHHENLEFQYLEFENPEFENSEFHFFVFSIFFKLQNLEF
jgi:hypothetical protein